MPGQHARVSPSKMARILGCPGSLWLEEQITNRFGEPASSKFAEEGTAAHSVCELKLHKELGDINQFSYDTQVKQLMADHPSYDWKKIEWATDIYVDTVMGNYYAAKKVDPAADLMIETRVDMSEIIPGCWGTSDAIVVSDGELVVQDYKNGAGVAVTAVENPQARLYGLGATLLLGDLYKFKTIRNVIIQPNLQSITEETISKEDLIAWGKSIAPTVETAVKGDGEYHSGSWCQFCAAKALCYHRAMECMKIVTDSGMGVPGIIPDSEIPKILECADVAKKWIEDIQSYAQAQALKGQQWPGFKLVEGRRPPRKWTSEEDVIDQLSRAGYSDDKIFSRKLISTADAEKLLGKAAFRAILGPYVNQGPGAPTLVPESDKRLAVNSSEAAFSDLI